MRRHAKIILAVVLLVLVSACFGRQRESEREVVGKPAKLGDWREVGEMEIRRGDHSAVLLRSGEVLVIGGRTVEGRADRWENSCELYDPKIERWRMTRPLCNKYGNSTAFVLNNGKVLVIGRGDYPYDQCELYDPSTQEWSSTGSLIDRRDRIHATLLSDGQVLVAGGDCRDKPLASCERYDPRTGNWYPSAPLPKPSIWHRLILLHTGRVLAITVEDERNPCLLYDPAADRWVSTATPLQNHGYFFFAIGLPDGRVLLVGGTVITVTSGGKCATINSMPVLACELYDLATEQWSPAATLPEPRDCIVTTATALSSGDVFIVGGRRPQANAVLYDVDTDAWLPGPTPAIPRFNQAATLLANGDLLISGGKGRASGGGSYLRQCEILRMRR